MKTTLFVATSLALALVAAGCVTGTQRTALEEQMATAKLLAPSLVRVEYTMKFDAGEAPPSGESSFRDERPTEVVGFLVSPTKVLTTDRIDYPRFIESIAIRQADEVVKAKFVGFAADHQAAMLELERPLKLGKPLQFDATLAGPYQSVTCGEWDGAWTTQSQKFGPVVTWTETGRLFCPAPIMAVLVDDNGVPVGMSMDGELPADDSWKGSPLDWKFYTLAEREALLKKAERGVVRVTLQFRSPPTDSTSRRYATSEEEFVTEMNVPGIALDGNRVLVLASLKPKVTARLETIQATVGSTTVTAKFEASLRDYGALVVKLDKPLGGAVKLSLKPPFDYAFKLLPTADVRLHGENRATYMAHRRIRSFRLGWHRQICPQILGRDETTFLFDNDGALVALPIDRREKVTVQDRYSSSRQELVFASYLKDVLADVKASADPGNIPLSELEENRLAWLGVELQPLNRDLARENKVSEQTRDGATGGLVSFVHPGSPAAKAGVQPGWILLRLLIEGEPRPLEVQAEETLGGAFPWQYLDRIAEEAFDRGPTPWPSAENFLARTLTDVGFGKKFKAEFFSDGKLVVKDFTVEQSPLFYNTAPRYKSAALGLTVRDMTYEVRLYFQKKETDPGVIVSKCEEGTKAAVAGIKRYEIITHVNDVEVKNVKEFEKLVGAAGDELRLTVKRMTQGRVVKIKMSGPAETTKPDADKPATDKPATDKPAAEKPAAEKPAAEKAK
jgi:serine protease Do